MGRLIDADALNHRMATLGRLARSDAQKALLGRALYIIDNMPTVSGWISVKDRLPEHGKRYLIYATSEGGKNHRITIAAYGGHFALSGRCAYWKVTHWMPLPEAPKEDEHEAD